ncbi:MAG: glpQ [Deltaproteobacteria bacterium]|nr:glpQ [Deltaproteobacteria bacterium]
MRAVSANPFLLGKHRPMVVGHRGVPLLHQENTLAGFRRAVALGIPAIELDVRLTADRRAVVLHDHSLRRLTGSSFDVDNLTWDQIARLRIRREVPMGIDVHGNQVLMRYEREERIPLLAEVLAEVASSIAINVELKLDMPIWWEVEVGAIVAKVIADAGVEDRVIVTSFDPRKLRALARALPTLAHGFCFDDTMLNFASLLFDRLPETWSAPRMLERILGANLFGRLLGTRLVGAEHTLIGRGTVRRLHEQGVAIGTHTLFPLGSMGTKQIAPSAVTEAEVDRLVELGVDWIETDDPERLQKLIG